MEKQTGREKQTTKIYLEIAVVRGLPYEARATERALKYRISAAISLIARPLKVS